MFARIAAALAAVPLAGPTALAADIPGNASTKATLQVTNAGTKGRFETAHDSDWYRVRLAKGQDYAVKLGLGYVQGWLTLRDAAWKPLKTTANYGDRDAGFEVRAPYTGTYFVEVKGKWYTPAEDNDYYVAVVHDCKDGLGTRCTLLPGKTYHYGSAWIRDYDVYAAVLDDRKRYTFTGTTPDICALFLQLLDGAGRVLVPTTTDDIRDYKPPRSGKYYLRANCNSDDYGGQYDLLLTVR
jgi:Bacterial pre-peptidase C-terminal domain